MPGLWEEVKTRKIFKAATIYAAIAWGLIQIADVLLPVLGIAEWVMSSMVLMAFSGFPVALIIGWSLDIKLERKKMADVDATGVALKASFSARLAELSIISLFGFGAAYLYYNSVNEPVQANTSSITSKQQSILPINKQKTIAVLPFANFSGSSDDEYFADGLSEELLNVLAKNKKLRVAARTSSFEYKNTNINVKRIAEELGVDYILEGSVRRSGDVIRVTAQLIKAKENDHIFSKTWDRNTFNIFKVQDEIAQSVLNELKVSLLGELNRSLSEIGTSNIEAFADYSRGLAFLRNRSHKDFVEAIIYFNKALLLDPTYAEAMAMLAETYLLQVSYGYVEFEQAHQLAKPLIMQALLINPNLASVHAVKGLMHWQLSHQQNKAKYSQAWSNTEIETAKLHFIKAIDMNPSLAEAYMWYGSVLQEQGSFTEGVKLRKLAYEIDPRAAVVGFNRASDLIRYGNYAQAMDVFNSVVRNNPNYPNAYSIAGDVSFAVGQLDQAYNMYNRLAILSEDELMWLVNSSRIYIPMGKFELAQKNLIKLREAKSKEYAEKFEWLQATIWLARKDFESFAQWTNTFDEETINWDQRFWRGLSSITKQKWLFAIKDLEESLKLRRAYNSKRVDEGTIETQLFIARAYQALGNQLKSKLYLDLVFTEITQLQNQGFDSQVIRFHQSALASLKGQTEIAISLLRQSVREGFVDFWKAEVSPIFSNIQQDPNFSLIRDELRIRLKLIQKNIESQYGSLALGR